MILHNDRPEDLETPVKYFDSWVTPVDAFFVRQHLPRPAAIDSAAYRVNLTGLLSKPLQVSLADLQKLPQHTVPATLECTGNGRAFFSQWIDERVNLDRDTFPFQFPDFVGDERLRDARESFHYVPDFK